MVHWNAILKDLPTKFLEVEIQALQVKQHCSTFVARLPHVLCGPQLICWHFITCMYVQHIVCAISTCEIYYIVKTELYRSQQQCIKVAAIKASSSLLREELSLVGLTMDIPSNKVLAEWAREFILASWKPKSTERKELHLWLTAPIDVDQIVFLKWSSFDCFKCARCIQSDFNLKLWQKIPQRLKSWFPKSTLFQIALVCTKLRSFAPNCARCAHLFLWPKTPQKAKGHPGHCKSDLVSHPTPKILIRWGQS